MEPFWSPDTYRRPMSEETAWYPCQFYIEQEGEFTMATYLAIMQELEEKTLGMILTEPDIEHRVFAILPIEFELVEEEE